MLTLRHRRFVTFLFHHWRYLVILLGAAATVGACESPPAPSQSPRCPAGPSVVLPNTGWPCPPASAIREIDAEVTLEFLDDPTAGTLVCHAEEGSAQLTRLQERAYQALYLLKRLRFDAPLPWTTQTVWEWFAANVRKIQYYPKSGITDNAHCCGPGDVMYIPVSPTAARAVDLGGFPTNVFGYVHEARHGHYQPDGKAYGHSCAAFDRTISEMGAYGVQYYFGLWLADHVLAPELTTAERDYARWSAGILRASSAFCTECGGL